MYPPEAPVKWKLAIARYVLCLDIRSFCSTAALISTPDSVQNPLVQLNT
jgi:hypothetical protein